MRTRTLAALAAGLLAAASTARPPGQPPAKQPPGTTSPTTPSPLGAPPAAAPADWPKQIGGKDLAGWINELKDSPDPAVRDAAIRAIPLFGPDARRPAMEPLLSALRSERDPGVRINAIDLLGVIGAEDPKQAKKITEALGLVLSRSQPGGPTRYHLIKALANYGLDGADGIPYVLSVITDPSWETRRATAYALGRLGFNPDAKKGPSTGAMKALVNTMLKDDSAAVRLEAAQALILLGPPAFDDPAKYALTIKPYLDPVLVRQKVEKDKTVQVWLLVLVMRYDGSQLTDANLQKLAEYVSGPDLPARVNALNALGMLGDKAKPAVPRIADALRFEEPELVVAALSALAALAEHARQALPELERLKAATKDEGLKAAVQETIDVILGKRKPAPAAPPMPPMPPKMP